MAVLSSLLVGAWVAAGGCATRVEGTAQPADTLGPTSTTTTTPTPALVPAAEAGEKLLKRDELASIVADTDMKQVASLTEPDDNMSGFDPEECGSRLIVGQDMGYFTDRRVGFAGNQDIGARGQVASQVIAVFADRDQPRATVRMSAMDWGACPDNQPFTSKVADQGLRHWTSGTITANEDTSRISTTSQRQEPPPHTCSHVMASQANVVVETAACGDGDTLAAANQIADHILAKVPQ